MKQEYMKPEAEMMKFLEEEELMNDEIINGTFAGSANYKGGPIDYTFGN